MFSLKSLPLLKHQAELSFLPDGKLLINTINAHSYNTARQDRLFQEALLNGDVFLPDRANMVLAANVTLLSGVIVGRGATVGAGPVVRKAIPPYAIAVGNPAKVVGFNFTPEEIMEHEEALYPEHERLPKELLEKNYNKYFINRIQEIKDYLK